MHLSDDAYSRPALDGRTRRYEWELFNIDRSNRYQMGKEVKESSGFNSRNSFKDFVLAPNLVSINIRHWQTPPKLHLSTLTLHSFHGIRLSQLPRLLVADENEVVRHELAAFLDIVLLRLICVHVTQVD